MASGASTNHETKRNPAMTTTFNSNGKVRKSLASQLDRFDTMLDGLGDAIAASVAEQLAETLATTLAEAIAAVFARPEVLAQLQDRTSLPADEKPVVQQATPK